MSGRIKKSNSSRKVRERHALADRILRSGFEMPRCSRCVSVNSNCVASTDSKRCASCVRAGRPCDRVSFSVSALERLNREEERLVRQKEEAFALIQETSAKLLRLERQQKSLRERGAEMLRRGLESLDELEELERREEEEKRSSEAAAAAIPSAAASTSAEPSAGKSLFLIS
jgi:hypothetical protein